MDKYGRDWMYIRRKPGEKYLNDEFVSGVEEFIKCAQANPDAMSIRKIRCPCLKCENGVFLDVEEVKEHLYRRGFIANYQQWTSHGEPFINDAGVYEGHHCLSSKDREACNPYRTMVIEVAGPSFNPNFDWEEGDCANDDADPLNSNDDLPNSDAQKFYDLLKAAEEPLYEGCETHTPLSAVSQLLNIKSEYNLSVNCFNRILEVVKEFLPKDAKLPKDFYKTRQMVRSLGLGYEKIDVCINGCMIYFKENKDRTECVYCHHPRFKPRKKFGGKQKSIPYKILRYLPLTPRLQRLYMSSKTAKHMTWHNDTQRESGVMCHPCGGEA